jgi:hypothetical protein
VNVRVDDEEDLREKVIEQKDMGTMRREWSMTFLVEDQWKSV